MLSFYENDTILLFPQLYIGRGKYSLGYSEIYTLYIHCTKSYTNIIKNIK